MTSTPRALALTAALLLLASGGAISAQAGQDPPPQNPPAAGETPDAKAAAYIKETKAAQAKQNEAEAKAAIGELVKIWKDDKVTPETKKGVLELLPKYARDLDQPAQVQAAIEAFGELSPEDGAKASLEVIGRALKAKEPNKDVVTAAFKSLKKLADPSKSTVGALVDYLKYGKDDAVVAKAADALVGYKGAPGKVRKDLFEELLKQSEGVFNSSTNADDQNAKRKWNVIGTSVNEALQALSGQSLANPAAARKWFNDNKKNAKAWS